MAKKSFLVGVKDDFNTNLASMLGIELIPVETRRFSDDEICPKTLAPESKIAGQHVIYCSRKAPDSNPQDYFVNFLFESARLHDAGAEITAVIPYLVYARQDKDFIKGDAFEARSIKTFIEALSPYVKEIVTVSSHFQREQGIITKYAVPVHNIDGFTAFDNDIKNIGIKTIIAPDKGMKELAEELSLAFNCPYYFAEKERDKVTNEVAYKPKEFNIKGRTVIIPDDMISSGGTMIKLTDMLRKHEPREIYVAVVHGAFSKGAYEKISGKCDKLLFTDTLKNEKATNSIVPLLSDYLLNNELVYKP